jgi:hypothetical protein
MPLLTVARQEQYRNDHVRGTEAQALEAVQLCVEKGLDVKTATEKGDTALHGAPGQYPDKTRDQRSPAHETRRHAWTRSERARARGVILSALP